MKLECDVVQDLFPLYVENDLSPRVKKGVEEHLKECNKCQNTYDSGKGFVDMASIHPLTEVFTPSKKLDEKLKLRLKIRRLNFYILVILIMFLSLSYSQFCINRNSFQNDLSVMRGDVQKIYSSFRDIKNINYYEGSMPTMLRYLQDHSRNLTEHYTPWERAALQSQSYGTLFIEKDFSSFFETLNLRYKSGVWSSRDEKAWKDMESLWALYLNGLARELEKNGWNSYTIGVRSLFQPMDTRELTELTNKINVLAYTYTRFNQFPDEIPILSEEKAKEKIKTTLQLSDETVTISNSEDPSIKWRGKYAFQIHCRDGRIISGACDAYIGAITDLIGNSPRITTGNLIPEETTREQVKLFLENCYGKEIQWRIKYLGININYSSIDNLQMYSYSCTPVKDGYPLKDQILLYANARTGKVDNITRNVLALYPANFVQGKGEVRWNPTEALHQFPMDEKEKKDYQFKDSFYISSQTGGSYELVHFYVNGQGQELYLNVKTGKEEKPNYLTSYGGDL